MKKVFVKTSERWAGGTILCNQFERLQQQPKCKTQPEGFDQARTVACVLCKRGVVWEGSSPRAILFFLQHNTSGFLVFGGRTTAFRLPIGSCYSKSCSLQAYDPRDCNGNPPHSHSVSVLSFSLPHNYTGCSLNDQCYYYLTLWSFSWM